MNTFYNTNKSLSVIKNKFSLLSQYLRYGKYVFITIELVDENFKVIFNKFITN